MYKYVYFLAIVFTTFIVVDSVSSWADLNVIVLYGWLKLYVYVVVITWPQRRWLIYYM